MASELNNERFSYWGNHWNCINGSQTACPHGGVLTVGVKAGVRSGCARPDPPSFHVNSRLILILGAVHMHFDCAGSHKTRVPFLGGSIFPMNSRMKFLL